MDKESKELFNALVEELSLVEERINQKLDVMQKDINILKARND